MHEKLSVDIPLPIGGKRPAGWWGVCLMIATESALFGYLLLSYYYLDLQSPERWPPEGLPEITTSAINTTILLSSSVFVWLAEKAIRRNAFRWSAAAFAATILLGAAFIGIQIREWLKKKYGMTTNLYGSLYFTITGFHMAHVAVGLCVLAFLLLWTLLGYFDSKCCEAIKIGSLYWHFVDIVWLFIFTTFFIVPYLQ